MPYPVANVPIPQAGVNIPMSTQLAYPLGMLLGGILPMLMGKKKDQSQSITNDQTSSPAPTAVSSDSPVSQAGQQQAQQAIRQGTSGAANLGTLASDPALYSGDAGASFGGTGGSSQPQQQQQQPDLNAQLQQAAQALQRSGMGGIGGLGGMAGGGNGTSPMGMASGMPGTQVQPQQGFHITPPSYAGTGPNVAMLQNYGLSGNMAPNQYGGISGPAGLNPLAQYQRRLAMLNLIGGNNGNNGSMMG